MRSTIRIPFIASLLLALACASNRGEDGPECDPVVCTAGHCEVGPDRAPQCVCGAYELAAGVECTIAYVNEPDADDTPEGAIALIPPVGPLWAELTGRNDDVDHYKVSAQPGHTYRFSVEMEVPDPPVLTLSPSALKERAPSTAAPHTSDLWFEAGDAGTYVLGVARAAPRSFGPYRYALEDVGVDAPPSSEPIVHGSVFSGEILGPGPKEEQYAVAGVAGDYFTIGCSGGVQVWSNPRSFPVDAGVVRFKVAPGESRVLEVKGGLMTRYDCAATVAHDEFPDDPEAPFAVEGNVGAPVPFGIQVPEDADRITVPVTDTHCYVATCGPGCRVHPSHFEANGTRSPVLSMFGDPGDYVLSFTDVGPDDHGDTRAEATVIGLGAVTRRYDADPDDDAFAFDPEPDAFYRWRCPGACSTSWRLPEDTSGAILQQAYRDGGLDFRATRPTTLFFVDRVPWSGDFLGRTVTAQLTLEGRDDHGDSRSTATVAQPDVQGTARIQHPQDSDRFVFALAPGRYRIDAAYPTWSVGLRLDGEDGTPVPSTDGVYNVSTAGAYLFSVFMSQDTGSPPTPAEPYVATFMLRAVP